MKKIITFFAAAVIMIASCVEANGQFTASANASTTATIVAPITISRTADMVLGTITPGATGGTLVLAPDNSRTVTGTVQFMAAPAGVAAAFDITASSGTTYTISIPAVTLTSGGNTMTLNTFTNSLGVGPNYNGTGAAQNVTVGGTLTVAAGQAAGVYNGTVAVTVAYN